MKSLRLERDVKKKKIEKNIIKDGMKVMVI